MSGLSAGVVSVVITPPIGIPMVGFAGRGISSGVHDDLRATALVLVGESERAAVIACDLLGVGDVAPFANQIAKMTDIPAENVIVAASHTHYGPAVGPLVPGSPELTTMSLSPTGEELVSAYTADLINTVAGAVSAAREAAEPCRVGIGWGSAALGINRRERKPDGSIVLGRNPGGPCDPRVGVIRLERERGGALAAIVNFACHPVSLGARYTEISAEYPGVLREVLADQLAVPCVFLQGAAGDVNPLVWTSGLSGDWANPGAIGLALGAEVYRIFTSINDFASGSVKMRSTILGLPPLLPLSIEEGEARATELRAQYEALSGPDRSGQRAWAERRLRRVEGGLAELRGEATMPRIPAQLEALQLRADIAVATAPAEIFTEIGRSVVDRSPFAHTLYAGYTNGRIGYVPTVHAYEEGGYEVTHACNVGPKAGTMIADSSVDLLNSLR